MTVPALPAGAPWWEWLLGLVIIAVVTLGVTWLQSRPVRKVVRQVAADTAVVRTQTENEHEEAEFPNLRDELTAVRELLIETRRDIGGIRSDLRATREDAREARTAASAATDEARNVASDLAAHLADTQH